jgi:hypothetical protein
MSLLGEPPENRFGKVLRYVGYFLFGAFLGLVPAVWLVAATGSSRIAWRIPVFIVLGSGVLFCLLGILTRGRLLSGLFRLFGKNIDPNSWPW